MSQVNLLPPGLRQRQETRRLTMIIIGGGVVLIVLVLFIYTLQKGHLSSVNDEIIAAQGTNASLTAHLADLQKYEAIQQKAIERQSILETAFAGEAPFSTLLQEISSAMPADANLTTLSITIGSSASASTGTTTAPTSPGSTLVGQISIGGQALGTSTISDFLNRLNTPPGWVNPWIGSFTETATGSNVYTFSGTIDLTGDVLTKRGLAGAEAAASAGGT